MSSKLAIRFRLMIRAWAGDGFGAYVGGGTNLASGTGSGEAQAIVGSVQYHHSSTTAKTDRLVPGIYKDTLTYTLTF